MRRFDADSDDYVLDPFSGLGTTLFTSMLSGVPSVGVDKLPIAHFVSKPLPVDLVLSEMAEEVGFEVREIIVARYKGNSSQQMRKYGKVPVRERIVVVWER